MNPPGPDIYHGTLEEEIAVIPRPTVLYERVYYTLTSCPSLVVLSQPPSPRRGISIIIIIIAFLITAAGGFAAASTRCVLVLRLACRFSAGLSTLLPLPPIPWKKLAPFHAPSGCCWHALCSSLLARCERRRGMCNRGVDARYHQRVGKAPSRLAVPCFGATYGVLSPQLRKPLQVVQCPCLGKVLEDAVLPGKACRQPAGNLAAARGKTVAQEDLGPAPRA